MSLKAHAVRYGLKIIGGSGSEATLFAGSSSDLSTLATLAGESSLGSLFLRSDGTLLKKATDTNQVSDWVEISDGTGLTILEGRVDDIETLLGTLATDGTYTSGVTVAGDIDALDAQLETNASQITEIQTNQGDLVTLTGVVENSTDLGAFTGVTIADGLGIKSALQSLETQLEAQDVSSTAILEDGSNSFTGNQSMGFNRLRDLAAPLTDNDAARKADVDAAAAGMLPKAPVRVASTADVGGSYVTGTISGLGGLTIDGVPLINGDRVLLKDQTDARQNGIYAFVAPDTLVRSTDMDGTPSNEVQGGNSVFVNEGSAHADNMFRLDGAGILTLDTDNLNWIFFSRAESITASTGIVKTGLDIRLADAVASNGIAVTAGAISAQVDDTTIEISGNALAVKNGGITEAKLGNDVDADTFVLSATYASSAGTVTIGDTVETAIEKIVGNVDLLDSASSANTADIVDIRTTQGTSDGDTNLGTFTGVTISDSNSVKGALQELETAVEGNDSDITELVANQNDLITLSGVAENSTNLGTFTGSTISDANDVKGALQEMETAHETLNTEVGVQSLESSSAAVTTVTVLDTIPLADANLIKWVMYGSLDSTPTTMEAIEITAFHDGTSAVAYDVKSILNLGLDPIDVDVVINGANLELQVQAVSSTSYTSKRDIVL